MHMYGNINMNTNIFIGIYVEFVNENFLAFLCFLIFICSYFFFFSFLSFPLGAMLVSFLFHTFCAFMFMYLLMFMIENML